MKPPYPAVFVYLWCAVGITRAAKIVIVPPIMFESHLYIFKTLASALREQGHETVFLVSEGREVPHSDHYELQRYPGIFNSSTSDDFLQSKMRNIFSGRLTALELFDILDHYSRNCDMMVGNKALMARLRQEKFDLLLVDPNEMCGFVIAHLLGLKYAVFSTGLWYPAEVGAPAPLAYVPEFNSLLTDRMGLLDRMTNTVVYLLSRFGVNFLVLPKYDRIMRKYNVLPDRSMYQLVSGSCLWMLCTDVALEFPRPTLPNVVYVGGILTKPASALPQARLLFKCRLASCNDRFGAAIAYQFPRVDPLQSQLCKGCEALLCRSPFIQNRSTCYHLTGCYGNQGWKKWAFLCGTDEEAEICRELIAKRAS